MQISRTTPCNNIEIWQPRYKDRVVLIAQYKVGVHNQINFTKAKHLMDNNWYLSGATIRNSTLETNGKIPCYAVSVDLLEPLERV